MTSFGQQPPNIAVDSSETRYTFANAAQAVPSVDECILDLGVTTAEVPPHLAGAQLTPELASQMVQLRFKQDQRLFMTWPAAKRLSRLLSSMIEGHEATFGPIPLAEEMAAQGRQPEPPTMPNGDGNAPDATDVANMEHSLQSIKEAVEAMKSQAGEDG